MRSSSSSSQWLCGNMPAMYDQLRHWLSIAGMSPPSHYGDEGDEEDGRIGLSSYIYTYTYMYICKAFQSSYYRLQTIKIDNGQIINCNNNINNNHKYM